MKITNKYNLPQPFVDLVSFDDYSGHDSDYTTTSLLRPPRIAELSRRNWDKLEEDASDLVWRMSGQTKHVVLERIAKMNPDRYVAEKRLYIQINGFKVSGQIDLLDRETTTLYDWKETSIWKLMVGDKEEWTAQANTNLMLARENGHEINHLENIVFLKDWKMRDAAQKQDYPEASIQSCPLSMWPLDKTRAFVEERIVAHEAARIELPLCSTEERWSKPGKWALMKKGQKRAVKLYDTEEQAQSSILQGAVKPYYVEHRPGENTRCEFYCSVSQHCQQFRDIMEETK